MKNFYLILFCIAVVLLNSCITNSPKETKQKIIRVTDMAGREVAVPDSANKVISNNLPGTILLYSLADSLLIARNNTASSSENMFCTERYCNLPLIGSWFSTNGTRNTEEIIRLKPDLIISAGNISLQVVEITDRDQELLQIPMILVSTDLTVLDSTYQFLGKLLNREEKTKELVGFYKKYIPEIFSNAEKTESVERKRIYIAMGENGLLTPPASSLHSQVSKYAGAINVAEIDLFNHEVSGVATVSLEQVINWAPDIILACGGNDISSKELKNYLLTDKKWGGLSAVKSRQVFAVPASPYLWLDRPPSINQMIGVIWLAKLLYPERFSYEMGTVVHEFYRSFYHRELTESEIAEILDI